MQEPPRRRPGDLFIRRPRIKPVRIEVAPTRPARPKPITPLLLPYGFASLIGAGTLLLLLPPANTTGGMTPFVSALFTSTSAVTCTGLIVEDTATFWSPFGKAVILVLMQLGGLGFMTYSTLVFIFMGRRIGLRQRLAIREAAGATALGGIVRLMRDVGIIAIVVEGLAVIALTIRFALDDPLPTALWYAVFHTVSSFNNAGFDVFRQGFMPYQRDAFVLVTTAALVMLGSISAVVIVDLMKKRGWLRLTLDTKLVIATSLSLWALGIVLFLSSEYHNPLTMGAMSVPDKVLNAFFQSVTPRTAGFAAVSPAALQQSAVFFTIMLMFIGGAAGSTAGGIKVNAFAVIMASVWATIRGRPQVEAYMREIPDYQVSRAVTIGVTAILFVLAMVFVLTITEARRFLEVLFETVSAFATVGLSLGLTPELSNAGQVIILLTMFVGKLGPLSLVLALAQRSEAGEYRYAQERVRIG